MSSRLQGRSGSTGEGRGVAGALLALFLSLHAGGLSADSLRCGRKVVKSGDSPATLLRHCGEPLYRGKTFAEINTRDGKQNVRVDEWHYKPGARSLIRVVLIYQGEIVAVESGSR